MKLQALILVSLCIEGNLAMFAVYVPKKVHSLALDETLPHQLRSDLFLNIGVPTHKELTAARDLAVKPPGHDGVTLSPEALPVPIFHHEKPPPLTGHLKRISIDLQRAEAARKAESDKLFRLLNQNPKKDGNAAHTSIASSSQNGGRARLP